jgi:hypothetical protein
MGMILHGFRFLERSELTSRRIAEKLRRTAPKLISAQIGLPGKFIVPVMDFLCGAFGEVLRRFLTHKTNRMKSNPGTRDRLEKSPRWLYRID